MSPPFKSTAEARVLLDDALDDVIDSFLERGMSQGAIGSALERLGAYHAQQDRKRSTLDRLAALPAPPPQDPRPWAEVEAERAEKLQETAKAPATVDIGAGGAAAISKPLKADRALWETVEGDGASTGTP